MVVKKVLKMKKIKPTNTLYIDYDEVLVSLASLFKVKGLPPYIDDPHNWGRYNLCAMANQSREIFWDAMSAQDWADLDPLPWFRQIVDICMRYEESGQFTVRFLTAPIMHANCYAGKFMWTEKYFPNMLERLIIGRNKQDIVGHSDIIIDDSVTTYEYFKQVGKESSMILFPSMLNYMFDMAIDFTEDFTKHKTYSPLLESFLVSAIESRIN